ncbi:MAG: tail fiber assembly protein [Candidatus Phlomobacter fragariae]
MLDHRGKTAFDTTNRDPSIIDYIVNMKAGFTFSEPKTLFDYWDREKWVTDEDAEKKKAIRSAKYEKCYRIDSSQKSSNH